MRRSSKKPAVFLDRDGTIINERGYLATPDKMVFYKTAFVGLHRLFRNGFRLVIISNQSGIARGYFSEKDLREIHRVFRQRLAKHGVSLAGIYYCPHLPTANCRCRKPKPYLALKAARDLNLDLSRSFFIGDHVRDMGVARAIGAKGVLVLTGWGRSSVKKMGGDIDKITSNLSSAARWILNQPKRSN
jgi:D-glycero-D-manno-heptose 1,7-bisphosphate phosphatase